MKLSRRIIQFSSQKWLHLLAVGLFLTSPVLTLAAPGDLDTTFGIGGKVNTLIGSSSAAGAVAVQSDGKIIVAGVSGSFSQNKAFAVARYNVDGSLDTSFDGDGKVITSFGNSNAAANAVAVQSDGKIVVAGVSNDSYENDRFSVVRYNSDGSLDTSFDGDGKKTISIVMGQEQARDVAIQPNGKIVIVGGSPSIFGTNFAVIRLNSDGTFDSSFDGDGKVLTRMGHQITGASSVAIQQDGKIIAAGDGIGIGFDFALVRYNSDGSLDTTFDGDGKVITSISNVGNDGASGVAIQSDGKIVAAGVHNSGENFAVVRYNINGSLDTSFNGTGIAITSTSSSPEFATSVAIQQNGKIVVAGGSSDGATFDFAIVRYNANGSLDTSFDGDGILITDFGNDHYTANCVVIQQNGKIVAAGSTFTGTIYEFAVARYTGDAVASSRKLFDFDGDGKADQAVFRPSDRVWYLLRSSSGFTAAQFGISTDKITPADFDGDGKTDISVFRDGVWYWLNSSNGSFTAFQFGLSGDIPVPADYTGDGRAELAVYRAGIWYTWNLANSQFNAVQFGISTDKPIPADFDADGKTDFAVYRDGVWYMLRSTAGFTAVQFGIASDKSTVGDYDGDGRADQAVYRSGVWYVLGSTQGFYALQFGIASDIPVAADYDGDGKTDIAVYRDGVWYMLRSQQGFSAVQFGLTNDKPIPAAYVP